MLAPTVINVGIAGTGRPSDAPSTLRNTTSAPYCAMSSWENTLPPDPRAAGSYWACQPTAGLTAMPAVQQRMTSSVDHNALLLQYLNSSEICVSLKDFRMRDQISSDADCSLTPERCSVQANAAFSALQKTSARRQLPICSIFAVA